ncbi:hypothetical protein [Allorhodopirellula heiligendammensis]|uniref:Uncharacterized protein n=1 Tax=Allorhodopirellula heiligendammensis TaxID=2714739 RepID=A0A5C6B2G9_9BACT|nr:hypothetical protein [Allorhodopirellula heiligendammensis]TWU05436.1 hypothetical protein Poly21_56430 [Allorhodopirellula heiligendammensis]
MRFHAVSVVSTFINTGIRAIHSSFFHGKASLGGTFPTAENARLAFDVDTPLRLHKNIHDIADHFLPEHELVVSDRVAERLSEHQSISIDAVSFAVLYEYPYSNDDPSCGFDDYDSQMSFIDTQADVPDLHNRVGSYFHVSMPPVFSVRKLFPDAPLVDVTIKYRPTPLPISPDVFAAHPMYTTGSATIMSDDVFRRVEPFINWTYFDHLEFGHIA